MNFKQITFLMASFAILGLIIFQGRNHQDTNNQVTAKKPIAVVNYICQDNKSIQASYYKGDEAKIPEPGQPPVPTGRVEIRLSEGKTLTLPQTISGSGIRYANTDESFIFWSKGKMAFILENNQETYRNCIGK